LVGMTQLIRDYPRDSDYVIRYGGEKFPVCPPKTSGHIAVKIADRLRTRIAEQQFDIAGHIAVSIGVAEYNYGESQETYIKHADQKI
jgi:diguanylate cyclase (GGDEF)-like protein